MNIDVRVLSWFVFFVFLSFLFPHVRSVACLCTGEWTQGDEGVRTPEARYGGSGETSGSDGTQADLSEWARWLGLIEWAGRKKKLKILSLYY
jgi:hypothetical protein